MKNVMESKAALGELFFKAGIIQIDDLCQAIYLAHKYSLPCGRVFTMLGLTRHRTLEEALQLQNLVRQNILNEDMAAKALALTHQTKANIKEILTGFGWQGDPFRNTNSLETLLVEANILTQKNVYDAQGLCHHLGLPLTRVLILQGLVSPQLMKASLNAQYLIRQGKVEKAQALASLSSSISLIEFEKACDTNKLTTASPFIRLEELLLLAKLLTISEVDKLKEQSHGRPLGQLIVDSGMFSANLIAGAVKLQAQIAAFEISPHRAKCTLQLVFEKGYSLQKASQEMAKVVDKNNQPLSLYHLLRLSGLITAHDLRRLSQLPAHKDAPPLSQESVIDRLIRTGIINKQALEAAKRCHILYLEGFISAEQAMIVLHQWSWSGEGFTRTLEKLQWADGKKLPTLRALAFRS
jgi:hypothetical protein